MYKVAFDESVRALEDQADELSSIRQRLVGYLAFILSATAFLVGSSINPQVSAQAVRDGWFYGLAITGTSLMVITVLLAIGLFWPRLSKLSTTASAKKIIDLNIDRKLSPVQNVAELYRDLALYNDDAVDQNDPVMTRARRFYFGAVVLGGLQLSAWVALVWHWA